MKKTSLLILLVIVATTFGLVGCNKNDINNVVSSESTSNEITVDEWSSSNSVSSEENISSLQNSEQIVSSEVTQKNDNSYASSSISKPPKKDETSNLKNSTSNPTGKTDNKGKQVYYTKTGKKYHFSSQCGRGKYFPCTMQEALNKGLEPCSKCAY